MQNIIKLLEIGFGEGQDEGEGDVWMSFVEVFLKGVNRYSNFCEGKHIVARFVGECERFWGSGLS